MLTLSEYKQKKTELGRVILELLADDSNEFTVYTLNLCCERMDGGCYPLGIFKKYENLKTKIAEEIEFYESDDMSEDEDNQLSADYDYFVINKYRLFDGEYAEELFCRLSLDGELLPYLPYHSYDILKKLDIPVSRNVMKAYETGDILRVNAAPMADPFYIIYVYHERRSGNKHLEMCFENNEFKFYQLHWLELTERVDACPVPEINEMSQKIKDDPAGFEKFFESQSVLPDVFLQ